MNSDYFHILRSLVAPHKEGLVDVSISLVSMVRSPEAADLHSKLRALLKALIEIPRGAGNFVDNSLRKLIRDVTRFLSADEKDQVAVRLLFE